MTPLRQRMIEDMQVLNLAPQTQSTYLLQVSLFARHFGKSPERLTFEHIRDYQVHLVREKKLATSSVVVAVSALRFPLGRSTHVQDGRLFKSRVEEVPHCGGITRGLHLRAQPRGHRV